MSPTLEPGDWLLVDPDAYADEPPEPNELVLVPDPRETTRILVKRVTEADPDGRQILVAGDQPGESTDSRTFGAVDTDAVEGRPWFRYWPPRRWGRIE